MAKKKPYSPKPAEKPKPAVAQSSKPEPKEHSHESMSQHPKFSKFKGEK